MAFDGNYLTLEGSEGSFKKWKYSTLDALETVQAPSYFVNRSTSGPTFQDIKPNFAVGDHLSIDYWQNTINGVNAIFLGTIDYKIYSVVSNVVALSVGPMFIHTDRIQ